MDIDDLIRRLNGMKEFEALLPSLVCWDSMGGTLFRIDRIDWSIPRIYYTFLDPDTDEEIGKTGEMDGIEWMEFLQAGDYSLHQVKPLPDQTWQ